MSYVLGVDLGTTYTAAAISRGGRLAMVELGTRTTTIPSVLYLRPDGTFLVGEPAVRRMLAESDRIAREFKRRFGDETPLLVGGAPFSAEACTAALLSWVVAVVSEREGGPPDAVAVAHPANWGEFRLELLRGVLRQARIGAGALVPEPVAAVAHYAATARVPEGGVVAVYDFGGGTFDAAVVRCTASGFNLLGRPEGIEHLGGVDLDVAVFAHVVRSVGVSPQAGQDTDPELLAALARLRAECVAVKEVLSSDTEAQIAVQLPGMAPTEVRLTRAELEEMIRPSVVRTIDGLQLALDSAGVSPAELAAVLLVGGSSRVPLVGRMVTEALGRPVALDAHPKHPVALGAALLLGTGAVIPTTSSPPAAVAVTPSVAPLPSNPDARAPVAVQSAAAHEVAAEVTTATEVVTATGDPLAPPVALSELSIASVAGVAAPKPSARFKLGAIPPAALAAVGAVAMLLFAVLVWVLTSDGGTEKTLPSSSASSSSSDLTTGSTAGTAGPTTGPTVTLPPLTMPPAAGGDAQFGRGAQRLLDALKSTPPAPSGAPARVVYVTALGTEASVEIFKKAAAEINTKLGGLAGRPIEVALCIPRAESSTLALSKADLLACSELQAAAKPVAVVQGVHPFGPESTEIFRAKGVTTIMDAAFYLPDAYPNQGVVTTSTINCLLLSAVMGDAALRAGKSRVAVIYQPVLGCGRSLKFLELSDDGWVAGLRAAGVTPVISVSQDRDRMPSEEDVARLIAAKPDAVLIHEGTICGELTKRFAKALPQAVPTIITTGCDKDRDPSVPLQYVGTDGCSSLAPGLDAEALARIKSLACSGESGALLLLWEVASEGAGMAPAVGPDRWRDVMFQGTRWFNRLRPEPLVFGAVPKYPGLGSTVQSFYATPAAAATLVELRDLFNR